jgi:hypothetical protein
MRIYALHGGAVQLNFWYDCRRGGEFLGAEDGA